MDLTPLRTRLAPTPSGLLHPGNGLSFIMTWAIARARQGQIVLRIDDLDKARTRKSYVEDVFQTLDWLGLDYDEGPSGVDDFFANWSQHTRLDQYNAVLDQLKQEGKLFACTCSRKQIRSISPDGRYPGTCYSKSRDFTAPQTAWRTLAPPDGAFTTLNRWKEGPQRVSLSGIDAFVVRQKNSFPAYQVASLVDDDLFGINFIVRGRDLWTSTLSQLYLAELIRAERFSNSTFWHHSLLTGADGGKLSKSKGAGSLKAWRDLGKPPQPLFALASSILGLSESAGSLRELVDGVARLETSS